MMNKLQIICTILLFLCLCSCRKLLQEDFPDFNDQWVIHNLMVAGDLIEVEIKRTSSINGLGNPPIQDAKVQLQTENGMYDLLYIDSTATYRLNQIIETNIEYHFTIYNAADELITSFNQIIPAPQPILSIEHLDVAGTDEEGVGHPAIIIEVPNNALRQYFFVNIKLLTRYAYESEFGASLLNIEDPLILNEGVSLPLFSNELMRGNSQKVVINYTTGGTTSRNGGPRTATVYPLVVELWTLNEAYFEFIKQNYQYEVSQYPIIGSGNQAAISNFDNIDGAYGINAGYSLVKSDTIYPSGTENYFNQ